MSQQGSLLVVDDNENNRDALSRRLVLKGYEVTVAASGYEALDLNAKDAFDLVLLDVEMPGMGGLEVLERLRQAHSATELPIIMFTARSEGADVVEAFRLGANDYVTKPIDFPVALARISTHLSHKQVIQNLRESEERMLWRRAAPTTGCGTGIWWPRRCTGRRAGKLCSGSTKRPSGPAPTSGSSAFTRMTACG
jgi:DNA-binding response OmpR family regulator